MTADSWAGAPAAGEASGAVAGASAAPASAELKAELRRQFRRLRRESRIGPASTGGDAAGGGSAATTPGMSPTSAAADPSQDPLLAAALRELPPLLEAGRRLALYWPLPGEPDLRPLAGAGVLLALPAVLPAEGTAAARMVFRPWSPGDPLVADGCGIPAPLASAGDLRPGDLGLLLAPALAFDPGSGIRLGQGGGWYDRLRADPAWAAVPALAVLPAACLRRGLPRDPWDVPFEGWLDGSGRHRLRKA